MGVLNLTPDSFSDGGRYSDDGAAQARIDQLLAEGADIIDVGGESTRPGAEPVSAEAQLARIEHAIVYAARERRALVSVDTTLPEVAERATALGASIVNDVSCLADERLATVTAAAGATLILMHARGPMTAMRGFSDAPGDAYEDVVADVAREWCAARERATDAGLDASEVVFDPGLGYMKNASHSLELIQRLHEFAALGAPLLVGPSRKSFIAKAEGSSAGPAERLGGTIAACLACTQRGATILRVHDVREVRQALNVQRAIELGHA